MGVLVGDGEQVGVSDGEVIVYQILFVFELFVDLGQVFIEFGFGDGFVFFWCGGVEQWFEVFVQFGCDEVQLFLQLVVFYCVGGWGQFFVGCLVGDVLDDDWVFVEVLVIV